MYFMKKQQLQYLYCTANYKLNDFDTTRDLIG